MGTQIATTTDYGSIFRPRRKTQEERDREEEARRRKRGGQTIASQNNAPSAGDQRGGENRGVSAPRTFKARQKNMEYKDHVDNLRALRNLGTINNGLITFPTTELKNKWTNNRALIVEYEDNNTQCDAGNSQACMLSGRGTAPTDYPSPFVDSVHYNKNSYFGVGDTGISQENKNININNPDPVESTETSQERVLRLREEAEEKRINDLNNDPNNPPPRPSEPPEGSGDGSNELPSPLPNDDRREGTSTQKKNNSGSGSGSHSGGSGSISNDKNQVEPLPVPNTSGVNERRPINKPYPINLNLTDVFNNRRCY